MDKKRYRYKKFISLIMSILLLISLTSCAGNDSGISANTEDELNIGFSVMPLTMDPQMAFDSSSFYYLYPMVGLMFRLDQNGAIVNELAEGYEVSDDGLTYTIHLRDDIRYSNGDEITANDFVYTLERIADPLSGSSAIYIFEEICEIKNIRDVNEGKLPLSALGVTATDERTLVIELVSPCPYFICTLTLACVAPANRAFVEKCGDLYATEAKYLLGSGAFYIDKYEPFDTQVHYSPNPYYYDAESVKLPGISVRYVQSQQQAMMCYESGVLDVINLSGAIQELTEGDEDVNEKSSGRINYMGTVPSHNKALENINIRRALTKTVNRAGIVKNITKKGTAVLERFTPAGFCVDVNGNDYVTNEDEFKDLCTYDPDEALKYWEQGLKELNVDSLKLSLVCRPTDESVVEMIVNDWEKLLPGLTIDAQVIPAKQYYDNLDKKETDLYVAGWGADYPDPNSFLELFTTTSAYNYADFEEETYNRLITESMTESDPVHRFEMLHEAEAIVMENGYYFPLYSVGGAWLISDKVKNIQLDFTGAQIDISRAEKNR